MPRENKVTKIMKEQRIFTVQGWLIDAVPNALIIKQIINNWNLSRRQAVRYLDEAFKEWNTETAATVEEKRQTRIAWLQNEIRSLDPKFKNTPQGKRTLLAFAKEISKLEALYPAKKISVEGGDPDKPLKFTHTLQAIEIVRITNEDKA